MEQKSIKLTTTNRYFSAYLDTFNTITIIETRSYPSFSFRVLENEREIEVIDHNVTVLAEGKKVKHTLVLKNPINIEKQYYIVDSFQNCSLLRTGEVVRTEAFDAMYYYEKKDLGAFYQEHHTTFKVWAPTAYKVMVKVVQQDTKNIRIHQMERKEKGVWQAQFCEDLHGAFYTYLIYVNGEWNEAVDPYAKALSVNGEYGVIINLQRTNPENWEKDQQVPISPAEAVIYELHVRDFSIHPNSGMKHKGKFKAFLEENVKDSYGEPKGVEYLKSLGVTHIELLPVQDFARVDEAVEHSAYNWGYDPLNYNALEGSYALDPFNPFSRINEFKQLVQKFHQNGLRVILDVVYNHVFHLETSSFEKIVPGYYFRYYKGGKPSNGTGVGNDTASERKMVRKFIVESVAFWAEEYHIDGFRFDLMGIHDVHTMRLIREKLTEINSSILIIGEGWNLPTLLREEEKSTIQQAHRLPGISHFNDQFRDAARGGVFSPHEKGFIGGEERLKQKMKRAIAANVPYPHLSDGPFQVPFQSVNYVEAHDNHTLWDRMEIGMKDVSEKERQARHRLGTALVLLSQGIPFIHAGQEFYRTKQGVEDSYNSPDEINHFDWNRKSKFLDYVQYVKGLIQIRKENSAFRLPTGELVNENLRFLDSPPSIIAYEVKNVDEKNPKRFVVIHNAGVQEAAVQLPNEQEWYIIVDGIRAGQNILYKASGKSIKVEKLNTMVLFQSINE
ncbi:type I pullulanase [Bacillus taeanensis]|uniref:type I pullulanase n=1 Tax=Bacillus taeanensis TaxID=273032 RepID=UPI0015F057D2|nr:type I pullulanase [Bacillus taeanensis]